jgi:hypothetical protein
MSTRGSTRVFIVTLMLRGSSSVRTALLQPASVSFLSHLLEF